MYSKDSIEANQLIETAEQKFIRCCKNNNVKYESKKFYEYQNLFFNGAACGLDFVPTNWGIGLMANRPIVAKW